MHTTLNKIYTYHPCNRGWNALLNYTGKTCPDDTPISFNAIIKAVSLFGAIWCLRALDGHESRKKAFFLYVQEKHTEQEIINKFIELFGE